MPHPQSRFHIRPALLYAAGAVLLAAGVALRILWYPVETSDYTYFVAVWFSTLAAHPWLSAFSQPFSDYAPFYLYALKLLSFIPLSSLFLSKMLSTAFDVVMASAAVLLARDRTLREYRPEQLFLVFACFLSIPTVLLNSALWGQSDALYAAPVLLSLYYILGDRPASASIAFGLALSMKVQAIFFLPVIVGYLWARRRTRRYLLILPAIFLATVVPAMLAGGDFWYWPLIYLKQSGEYPYLSVSAPSVFAFAGDLKLSPPVQTILFWAGIAAALAWSSVVAFLSRAVRLMQPRAAVLAALSSVLIIPYVLPRMHERYFFLADVIACALVLFAPRRWSLAVLVVGGSLLSYMPYLSSQTSLFGTLSVDLRIPATMFLVAIGLVLVALGSELSPASLAAERERKECSAELDLRKPQQKS